MENKKHFETKIKKHFEKLKKGVKAEGMIYLEKEKLRCEKKISDNKLLKKNLKTFGKHVEIIKNSKKLEELEKIKMKQKNVAIPSNELCECGHLRSKHSNTLFEIGHGSCKKCNCQKFSWRKFVEKHICTI